MGKRQPRRRRRPAVREAGRWLLCFGAAGLIQSYAYLDHVGRALGFGGPRPHAVRVGLVRPERMPPALRHPAEEPGQIADAASRRPEPTLREPFGPIDPVEARKLLDEARLVDDPLSMAPDALRESIEAAVQRRIDEGAQDPEAAVERAQALSRGVSTDSAREIADYLGYQAADFVPRTPQPPGDFDHDDAIIYDLAKTRHADGSPTYRITLVDRAGHTFTFLLPPGDDASAYDHLYQVLEAARQNPALMVILRRMALPMATRLARSADRQRKAPLRPQQPGAQPPPPPAPAPPPAPDDE